MEYARPNWTNFGFGNGGHPYPARSNSAHPGEKLPIAMNMSADKTFELKTPKQSGKQTNLITRQPVESGSIMKVGPRTTVVIYHE